MPRYNDGSNIRQNKAIRGIIENGLTVSESMRMAGYAPSTVAYQSSTFLKRAPVIKALEKAGLTDKYLLKRVKRMINVGSSNENVSSETASKNIELAFRLKGYLNNDKDNESNNGGNTYIKELKILNVNQLLDKVNSIGKDIEQLKSN